MKTVIEMVREAKLPEAWISDTGVLKWSDLERFAELVRADAIAEEREACAKVCDDLPAPDYVAPDDVTVWDVATLDCAEAIRARSNT